MMMNVIRKPEQLGPLMILLLGTCQVTSGSNIVHTSSFITDSNISMLREFFRNVQKI